ncbi:MAG: FAD-binding oxidoreductase [Myxococcota bacterium]|jgi:4-cresol dehydrogenase (hydroxylating)
MGDPMLQEKMLDGLRRLLGDKGVVTDPAGLGGITENTLGVPRVLAGCVYPRSVEDVAGVVALAREFKVPIYPISRGRNIGYGERIPVLDGQLLVDLSRMNAIREFNPVTGHVMIEPGVTQIQLHGFLKSKNAAYWMDATGAGLDASIVGNTLEGGFGHTPRGNRRANISDVEIVLGNGVILRTGQFPGLGPDLAGLFVQSNFGVVTAMRVALMPVPESFESFMIGIKSESDLPALIDTIRSLRQQDSITSLVHVANAMRSYITTNKCPEGADNHLLSSEEAARLMSTAVVRVGLWTAIGGIYGSRDEVRARKKVLRRAFARLGHIAFFSDWKIGLLVRLLRLWPVSATKMGAKLLRSLLSYREMHGLMRGVPSDEPLKNILWRAGSEDDMGLVWFSPAAVADGGIIKKIVDTSGAIYARHGFEMPVTVTLVAPDRVVCAFSISFDLSKPGQRERAHTLYKELRANLAELGLTTYRLAVMGMEKLRLPEPGRQETLLKLKEVLDPYGIISPGRYGM